MYHARMFMCRPFEENVDLDERKFEEDDEVVGNIVSKEEGYIHIHTYICTHIYYTLLYMRILYIRNTNTDTLKLYILNTMLYVQNIITMVMMVCKTYM